MSDDDLVDPPDQPGGAPEKVEKESASTDADLVTPNDNLDLEFVDEFDASDFDEDVDDDFEEEVEGEYELADDHYGEEFDREFGHLTDPTRAKKGANKKSSKGAKAEEE